MPVLPSSKPNDSTPHTPADSVPHTPNDGSAETTAGKWPPRERDPFDPACDADQRHEHGREAEPAKSEKE
jgi:hypothetical protein